MATINFNANEVEPSVGFEAIPAGKYQAVKVLLLGSLWLITLSTITLIPTSKTQNL